MDPQALLLSRAAMADAGALLASLAFGVASYVAVLEALRLATANPEFRAAGRPWRKALPPLAAAAVVVEALAAWSGAALFVWPDPEGRAISLALAAWLATALVVGGASAWRLLKDSEAAEACLGLKMALGTSGIAALLQLVSGGLTGDRLALPKLAGPAGPLQLQAFEAAVALGVAALALALWGGLLCWRSGPERSRPFLIAAIALSPAGLLAILAGRLASEVAQAPLAAASSQVATGRLTGAAIAAVAAAAGLAYLLRLIAKPPTPAS